MKKAEINQYLIATCLYTIDELNERYCALSKEELKVVADQKFNEMDVTVMLGNPFKQRVHYTVGDSNNKGSKVNHDLYVEDKDFKIEVKYLKNWKSNAGTYSNSKPWVEYQKDFDWLAEEIKNGARHKRAFVIGWFNCVDTISRFIQLGTSRGNKSPVSEEKLAYFPFLKRPHSQACTTDLTYIYERAYAPMPLNLIGKDVDNMDCIFLGNEDDVFHFAIYY